MDFIWEDEKNEWLKLKRSISFEELTELIRDYRYLDIRENPTREGQFYFILPIREYTWVVPFVFDDEERIVLKTAYPSRKFHNMYIGRQQ